MFALATYANADRVAWPGAQVICDCAGQSEQTVRRALRRLESLELISIVCRGGASGGR
ncbi:MAG: helix-turn-helix domain-containing protein, partial [Rhodobacteraceae bacterium]|nr:helix-turn-helix domain-containing protein [Paracoccaceae bacterium]